MAKDFAKAFYRSQAWQDCRAAYIKKVGGLCEDCLAKGIYTPGKIVHHKKHLTADNINDPTITLSWINLKFVCQNCHALEHAEEKRYYFDSNGNLITTEA